MTARRFLIVSLVLVLGLALAPAAGAASSEGVYLSLGDSVAAGTSPMAETGRAYTDILYQRVRWPLGLTSHVDVSCPGEDSGELIDGDGSYCFTPSMTQLDHALAVIAADPGAVKLITINIGANDVLACTSDPDMETCVGLALNDLAANLQVILTQLRTATAGYDVPIVAMNYYNPLLGYQLSSVPAEQYLAAASPDLVSALNETVLEPVYGAIGVPVADVATKFRIDKEWGARYPLNLKVTCRLTYMCERDRAHLVLSDWLPDPGDQPDIHPNRMGHRRIASSFIKVMWQAGIL